MKKIKGRIINVEIHKDEILVEMMSALGCCLGSIVMPKTMEEKLKEAYIVSGTVKSTYLYIDGIEITDGKNHNPYYMK